MAEELTDILQAIREVEANLDRRVARTGGALLVMWGVISVLIGAFYQLVAWNEAPYAAALGPLLGWAWLAPLSIGYAVWAVVSARTASAQPAKRTWRGAALDV